MSGRRAFTDLTKDFPAERRERVDARKAALRRAMPLHELRRARACTSRTCVSISRRWAGGAIAAFSKLLKKSLPRE